MVGVLDVDVVVERGGCGGFGGVGWGRVGHDTAWQYARDVVDGINTLVLPLLLFLVFELSL